MIKPLVVATDLDGTLLRSDSTLSGRTRAELRKIRASGTRVVAATARPPRVIDDLFGDDDLIDVAICGNGAIRYEAGSHDIRILHAIPDEVIRRVVAELAAAVPGVGFAVETGQRVLFEPNYRYRPTLDNHRVPVATVDDLFGEDLVKVMVWLPDEDPDAAWALVRDSLGPLVECTWSAERAPLEIAATGVSKAATLAEVCAEWDVPAEAVLAFGDAPNDLPMLAWAGTGIAVANAHPAVLAAVEGRTASNDEDGVAAYLAALFSR
ncbi:MAG: HAD family phosphatase [Hamadaea sp.]|nr:HAD family phosphatase [Hamadaea sp.]